MASTGASTTSSPLSAVQLSGNEKEVIERKLSLSPDPVDMEKDLSDFYEISRCVDAIKSGNFEKVALQFPDSFLADSAAVTSLIENKTSKRAFVLADTSYGSCCIDEVAAEHVNADLIIHYGRVCLSQTRRLPVLHVFGKWPISIQHCSEQFRQMFPDPCVKVLVFCDVMYSHCIGELEKSIKGYYPNIIFSKLVYSTFENELKEENSANTTEVNEMHSVEGKGEQGDTKKPEKNYFNKFGREFRLPLETQLEDYSMFYIGGESLCLTNLIMFYNKCQFYSYDPVTDVGRKKTVSVNKALMKRYYMIERAKDAQVIGIVVGTLGVADYLQSIERLKKVIKLAGKKSYLFVMGKLNVAKMANFMEIDVFVLVACPENTLIDSKEFYKPIVTPFEMELACIREREWTGDYITDFRDLLPGASASVGLDEEGTDQSSDSADVSLITGKLRVTYDSSWEDAAGHSSRSLVERNQETTLSTQHHTSAGAPRVKPFTDKITLNLAEYLSSRSWRGLEQKQGETPVTKAVEGRKGIAAGYTHEEELKQDSSESTSS